MSTQQAELPDVPQWDFTPSGPALCPACRRWHNISSTNGCQRVEEGSDEE